jgi:hypothetical protein
MYCFTIFSSYKLCNKYSLNYINIAYSTLFVYILFTYYIKKIINIFAV